MWSAFFEVVGVVDMIEVAGFVDHDVVVSSVLWSHVVSMCLSHWDLEKKVVYSWGG